MALDFPNSPSLNDTYTSSGRTWQWNGTAWEAVTTGISANSISTTDLADNAVTTAKISNLNVTTAKIADENITAGKLATDAVTTAKILDGAVTEAKLATAAQPAMVLIKTQAVGNTLTSVEVTGAFSADYKHYRVIWTGGTGSASEYAYLTLGATATNYYWGFHSVAFSAGTIASSGASPGTNFPAGAYWTSASFAEFELFNPYETEETYFWSKIVTSGVSAYCGGLLNNTTSYTAFTLTRGGSTTFSGGTIYVYGYKD